MNLRDHNEYKHQKTQNHKKIKYKNKNHRNIYLKEITFTQRTHHAHSNKILIKEIYFSNFHSNSSRQRCFVSFSNGLDKPKNNTHTRTKTKKSHERKLIDSHSRHHNNR